MINSYGTERLHAALDYLWALFLVMSPLVNGIESVHLRNILVVCGISIIVYSVFTDYGGGIIPVLNRRAHLLFDCLVTLILVFSPWILEPDKWKYALLALPGLVIIVLTRSRIFEKAPSAPIPPR